MSVNMCLDGIEWMLSGGTLPGSTSKPLLYLLAEEPPINPQIDISELDLWPQQLSPIPEIDSWTTAQTPTNVSLVSSSTTVRSSEDDMPWGLALIMPDDTVLMTTGLEDVAWTEIGEDEYESDLTVTITLGGCTTSDS